jgi:hypothetical protein
MSPEYRQKYGSVYRTFCGDISEVWAHVHAFPLLPFTYGIRIISDLESIKVFFQDAKMHTKTENLGFGEFVDN